VFKTSIEKINSEWLMSNTLNAITALLLMTLCQIASAEWLQQSYPRSLTVLSTPDFRGLSVKNQQILLSSISVKPGIAVDTAQFRLKFADATDIHRAELTTPSRDYPHGALGDDWEFTELYIIDSAGAVARYRLPGGSVFEDNRVLAMDLDKDQRTELLLVRSQQSLGAQLVLFGLREGSAVVLAESQPIGTAFRWMNPVGAGDMDGDGRLEVLAVRTPHIGGTLEMYRLEGRRLRLAERFHGVSNHRYGSAEQRLSVIVDADGDKRDEVIVPTTDMDQLLHLDWSEQGWIVRHRLPLVDDLKGPILVDDVNGDGQSELIVLGDKLLTVYRYRQ